MGHRILVADDEAEITLLLKTRLELEGYAVSTVGDGIETLQQLMKPEKPNLILMDNLMPRMTGFQVLQEIQKMSAEVRKIPIIVISAKGSMRSLFEGLVFGFLPKPVDSKSLMQCVETALGVKPKANPAGGESHQPAAASKTVSGKGKRIVLVGVDAYILDKMKVFLQSKGFEVFSAHDEKDAFELSKANQPQVVLGQFWEEPEKFDALRISQRIQKDPATQELPFIAFCRESIGIDALKVFPRSRVIMYHESKDLLEKLEELLTVLR